jgi:hypothetical protein
VVAVNEILAADTAFGLSATGWTAVTALGAVVTGLVALGAGVVAWFQLKEAKGLREEESRPYVVVSVEPSPAGMIALDIVIRNLGRTVAKNCRITTTPTLKSTTEDPDHPLAKLKPLSEPISLVPGQEIRLLLDRIPDRRIACLPFRYDAKVTYSNTAGQKWTEELVLDLAGVSSGKVVNVYGVHDVAKALQGIEKTLKGRIR